jgi:hypothetical protein
MERDDADAAVKKKASQEMNIERLEHVRDWLLAGAPERKFNMNIWLKSSPSQDNWCGTTCCIAGYCITQIAPNLADALRIGDYAAVAGEWLGLTQNVAMDLFLPIHTDGDPEDYQMITTEQAAQAVSNVIQHGKPMWGSILH